MPLFMGAALLGSAVLMLFAKRPTAIAKPAATPMSIPTHVGGISLPASAHQGGRLKTHEWCCGDQEHQWQPSWPIDPRAGR